MPPPRRPRDRLARVLRATADRLSAPSAPSAPESPESPESPAEVPRPPGEPPEHWRRLVAAHAPGLLRDLPPPSSPPQHLSSADRPPVASSRAGRPAGGDADRPGGDDADRTQTRSAQVGRLRRTGKALLLGDPRSRRGPLTPDPSRSWYERAPMGAVSYQDLRQVPEDETGVSGGGRSAPEMCVDSGHGAPGTEVDAGPAERGTAPSETGSSRPDDDAALSIAPACRSLPESGGPTRTPHLTEPAHVSGPAGRAGPVCMVDTTGTAASRGGRPSGGAEPPERRSGRSHLAPADRGRKPHPDDASATDLPPGRSDGRPLVFAAAPRSSPHGPATHTPGSPVGAANGRGGTGDGSAGHYPVRAATTPYGHAPVPDGDLRLRQGQRHARPAPAGPWPALPDDAAPARTAITAPAAAGRAAGNGGAHADPWPSLPGEPAWWNPATRATPWSDTARLDREQAGD
ncbi:hypothetical protein GA0070215_103312 [Micromonospora marina]|uniref:Uncharacterized protein n=1 Tax=Micromonospora marina TaxID=307120 RepID=A0A1C4VPP4_9ACTN|nr:hypothetical protein GA0070215_103312 [Micromonospora marina]